MSSILLAAWAFESTAMRTTHSYISVVPREMLLLRCQRSPTALTPSVCGCHQIDWSWMATRLSSFGLGSRQRLAKISKDNLVIQGTEISPLDSVRDLGVIIDCKLTMEDHVNSVVKSCFFQLRQLRSIRRSLPTDARKALVHSFVASRIDYCNAILYGVSDGVIRRMQTALNAAARLVVPAGTCTSILHTP